MGTVGLQRRVSLMKAQVYGRLGMSETLGRREAPFVVWQTLSISERHFWKASGWTMLAMMQVLSAIRGLSPPAEMTVLVRYAASSLLPLNGALLLRTTSLTHDERAFSLVALALMGSHHDKKTRR